MGFIPDSFIGVWQHRRAWVPFINRRAIEMRFSCGNSSSGKKAFSVFVRRFEHRSTKMNSRVQVQGFIHENVKMWCQNWSFYQWKGFSIQRLSLDSQKWKWKWYKSTESIMSILSKWTLSSFPIFKVLKSNFTKVCDDFRYLWIHPSAPPQWF